MLVYDKRQLGFRHWSERLMFIYEYILLKLCGPDADQQLVSLKWSAEQRRRATATAAADSPKEKWSTPA